MNIIIIIIMSHSGQTRQIHAPFYISYVENVCFVAFQFSVFCYDSAVFKAWLGLGTHRVGERSHFALKYHVFLPQTWLETLPGCRSKYPWSRTSRCHTTANSSTSRQGEQVISCNMKHLITPIVEML